MTTQTEPRTIQEYAENVGVTYIDDVDPRCGGMFIAPRGEGDDHMNVLRLSDGNDRLYIECLTALTHGSWEAAAHFASTTLDMPEGVLSDADLAYAVVTYGYPVDPMQPSHMADDFKYATSLRYEPWEDEDAEVPDDDIAFMQLLIPYVDRILP